MSRARNIKPGFFKNEDLADLDPHTRLLFVGLWTMADREGRLENRPRKIKAELFPYESVDVESCMARLCSKQFLNMYEVDGEQYAAIPNWLKHQSPHHREVASEIPAPPHKKRKEKQTPTNASTVHESSIDDDSVVHEPSKSPDVPLIPDSGFSDSGFSDSGARAEQVARATRLPDNFTLTDERRLVAEAERLPAERTFAKFVDYWRGASGAKARKHDWDATWRNWCLNETDRRGPANGRRDERNATERDVADLLGR